MCEWEMQRGVLHPQTLIFAMEQFTGKKLNEGMLFYESDLRYGPSCAPIVPSYWAKCHHFRSTINIHSRGIQNRSGFASVFKKITLIVLIR